MSKLLTNSYPSLRAFVLAHKGLVLPRPYVWRLVIDQPVGQINGLPSCRGIAVVTNGILVAIEGVGTGEGRSTVSICHLEWFIPDETNEDLRELLRKVRGQGVSKSLVKEKANAIFKDLMNDFVG